MLTAIRDFAQSVFQQEIPQNLNQIQYDDLKITLEVGRHAYLAVVSSGVEPATFSANLRRYERRIHNHYSRSLRAFDGNVTQFEPTTVIIKNLLRQVSSPRKAQNSSPQLLPLDISNHLSCCWSFTVNHFFTGNAPPSRNKRNEPARDDTGAASENFKPKSGI